MTFAQILVPTSKQNIQNLPHVRRRARTRSSTTTTKMAPEAWDELENAYSYKFDGPEPHHFQPASCLKDWACVMLEGVLGQGKKMCCSNWEVTSITYIASYEEFSGQLLMKFMYTFYFLFMCGNISAEVNFKHIQCKIYESLFKWPFVIVNRFSQQIVCVSNFIYVFFVVVLFLFPQLVWFALTPTYLLWILDPELFSDCSEIPCGQSPKM